MQSHRGSGAAEVKAEVTKLRPRIAQVGSEEWYGPLVVYKKKKNTKLGMFVAKIPIWRIFVALVLRCFRFQSERGVVEWDVCYPLFGWS